MSIQSSTRDTVRDALSEQIRRRTYAWLYVVIPVLLLGLLFLLWLLTQLFNGSISPQNPLSLLITALVLGSAVLLGRAGYRYLERMQIQQHPLVQQAPGAVVRMQETLARVGTRSEIATQLRGDIQEVLHPEFTEVILYDKRAHYYAVPGTDGAGGLPADQPFVQWLLRQPLYVPVSLPAVALPREAHEVQQQFMERGVCLMIPLGEPGWVALGAPSRGSQEDYSVAEQSFLQYIAQYAAMGLERAAMVENQEQRAAELQSLYWITQAVNFSMEIDDLLELVYTQLKRVIVFPNFYIALEDPVTERLSFAFYIEDNERLYPEVDWSKDEGLTGVLLRNNMTLRTDNYIEECRSRGIEPTGPKLGYAWMGVALTAGDRSVGVMVASASTPDIKFSAEHESFFVTVASFIAAIMERHTLYERLAARARQLGTLNEIGKLLASSLDLNEVLDLVVRNAADLLNSEAGSLLLLDEDSGDLVFRVSSGPTGEKLIGMRVPAGKGIAGAAFAENRPVITQNTQQDQRWYGHFDQRSEFVTQSIIAVPLNTRGRTIGVLEVINRKDARNFDEEDSELLLSFAAQAAVAIENARLFTTTDQALQARLEELTTLQYIDRQLNATLDYRLVMDQTLEWALRITDATIGMIAALHEDEQGNRGLRFLAHKGYSEELFEQYTGESLWSLDNGLLGHTVDVGETTLVTDLAADPHYQELVPGMEAQLTVPIKREDRVIGAIALESNHADSFTGENVAFIERLADHAAIAIDNARLFQQVQAANAAKTEFISFVSHELKQPMTSMKGYCDLLTRGIGGSLNEQQLQFVGVIRNNVDRMDRLVLDLLDISRIESGRLQLEMGPVVPEELVSQAVQAFQQEIAKKHQEIEVDLPEDNLPVIIGDRVRLIQVLTNLVSNANKYTPEGGKITVHAESWAENGQQYVRWSVEDTGIGMTQEELDQLFTKYFRSKNAAVRSVQGTGLGLVITQSIVEMHGGRVEVASTYQQGSTFSFMIPLTQE